MYVGMPAEADVLVPVWVSIPEVLVLGGGVVLGANTRLDPT